MEGLHVVYQWTKTPKALVHSHSDPTLRVSGLTIAAQFVFRYVFLSVLLWLPSVIRHTSRKLPSTLRTSELNDLLLADFYYVQKGIWYARA